MTVQDIYNKVLALIDQYSDDGTLISEDDNIDIQKKTLLFVDMAQKELWNLNKKTKQIEITYKPPTNQIGGNAGLIDFEGTTQYYPNEDGVANVQGYSIQVSADASSNATITLEEKVSGTWTTLTTVTPTGDTELTTYKGILSVASTSNPVRMKIEGTQHFLHQNRALWKNLYKSTSVPTFEEWVEYSLPTDFNGIDAIVEEYDVKTYAKTNNYKLENYQDFYFAFDFEGSIRITYKPIPSDITALTDTLDIDTVLAQNIVYDVVSKLGFYENPDLVNWAEGRRLELNSNASSDAKATVDIIDNYYG